MTKLTPLSQKVFLFIKDYIDRERFAPSQVEIKEYLNHKTLSAVQDSLKRLEQLKKIERVKGKGRSIRLLD
tara:strand:- start:4157 stop:4369 length:213 start_codon:yes stop_codon:yes gene_type:complete